MHFSYELRFRIPRIPFGIPFVRGAPLAGPAFSAFLRAAIFKRRLKLSSGIVTVAVLSDVTDSDGPVAGADGAETLRTDTVDISVLDNDSTTSTEGATVTDNGDGTSNYDPSTSASIQALAPGESLEDTFTYTIEDGNGEQSTAAVTVTVSKPSLPQVTEVQVSDSGWTDEFKNLLAAEGLGNGGYAVPVGEGSQQLASLPWKSLDEIQLTFSEDVEVAQDDLSVTGTEVANYAVSGFNYDGFTYTATWTLEDPINSADQVTITLDDADVLSKTTGARLDGEWDNPANRGDAASDTFPSGDNAEGGHFAFRVNTLPGDADGNGEVDFLDVSSLAANFADGNKLHTEGNFDGNDSVDFLDVSVLAANFGNTVGSSGSTSTTGLVAVSATGNDGSPEENATDKQDVSLAGLAGGVSLNTEVDSDSSLGAAGGEASTAAAAAQVVSDSSDLLMPAVEAATVNQPVDEDGEEAVDQYFQDMDKEEESDIIDDDLLNVLV